MKKKAIEILATMVVIVSLIITVNPRISKAFERTEHFVTTSDGTKLAVTVMLPEVSTRAWPTIFQYLPYKRFTIHPQTGEIIMAYNYEQRVQSFIDNGYAYVIADMRGSGASFGTRVDMEPLLGQDGKEIIEWIAAQSWCDGNVGMIGGSYHGWSQFATAGQNPVALKAIMPEVMAFDMFADGWFPGGICNKGCLDFMETVLTLFDLNFFVPANARIRPALPVVDEDGDGELVDEIPLDINENGNFLDDGYPPTYSDGQPREHIYYQATTEHMANTNMGTWDLTVTYRDDIVGGSDTMIHTGPNNWPVKISESGIAVYNIGGWFDIFTRGTCHWYDTLKGTNPSKLLIHPSFHGIADMASVPMGPYWDYFGEDFIEYTNWVFQERLRFFERYLKGVANGVDTEPPVRIYVMNGKGWRNENEWPLARQVKTNYYFEEGNALSMVRENEGSDEYQADLTHASLYGSTSNGTRWIPGVAPDMVMKRTEQDLKCLSYTSAPLDRDTEITGHPIVTLWVSSTANYGDFFIYLEDVDETGEAFYMTEGILRAGFANTKANEDILLFGDGIDVMPDLPWHGYKQADYTDGIFTDSAIEKLVFDLLPTSWVIKKGHRIRVSIACADWPTFRLHPQLCPTNDPNDPANIVPTVTVYRTSKHSSHIELPVIYGTSGGDKPCFIATAAYGSPFDSHVRILRRFRDVYLMPSRIGQAFVGVYYKYSPPVADVIAKHKSLQWLVCLSLMPFVGVSWVAINFGSLPTLALIALFLMLMVSSTVFLFFRRIKQ